MTTKQRQQQQRQRRTIGRDEARLGRLRKARGARGGDFPCAISDPIERLEIGARLRVARVSRGWSQVHTAAEAGISQPYLSELERGRPGKAGHPGASLPTLRSLARALGVRFAWLVHGEGEPPVVRFPAQSRRESV